jgi:hypothetical protein
VRTISVPAVVIAAQGHYFIRDGEQIFEELASSDKEFLVIEGMNHNLGNCTACATFHGTGPYTNVPLNLWNYVAAGRPPTSVTDAMKTNRDGSGFRQGDEAGVAKFNSAI